MKEQLLNQKRHIKAIALKYVPIMCFMLFGLLSKLHAQVSVTASAGTVGPTSYATVNAALAAITAGTHQGDVLITITGNTSEPTFSATNQLVASGTGLANYQSVRIVPQGNVVVNSAAIPTANRGMLEFIGADSVTIDGDDPLTPGTRNLTFQVAMSTNTYTSALRFSSASATANTGCRAITVKNCIIVGSRNSATSTTINFGITASVGGSGIMTTISSQAADNDKMLIENNEFKRAYYGFHAYGHATNVMDSLVIRNNKFGNDTSALNMGIAGIYLGYTALTAGNGSAIIEGNEIQGGDYTTGWGASIAGLNLNIGNAGAQVRNNFIHDVSQPSSGVWGSYGIIISNGTSNNLVSIYNNIIKDISAFHSTSNFGAFTNYGIYCSVAATNLRIIHNTISLNKLNAGTGNSNSSACILINNASATVLELKNNILVNNQSDNTGQSCVNVLLNTAANFSSSTGGIDRNCYWVSGVSGFVGRIGVTNYPTLQNWRAITTKDSNSFFSNPTFISANNLRLQAGVKSVLESNGAVTSIITDIDGNVRPGPVGSINGGALAPDIGAHEADMMVDNKQIDSVIVTQITGFVSPGNTNQGILRIAAHVSGTIGNLRMSSLYLNTAGSTAAADIANAKVYFTGSSSVFNITTAYGTVVNTPNGVFVVSDTTLINTGVNYFWLAYDINGTATNTNVVDARLDSIQFTYNATPGFLLPVNGNPAGNVVIAAPMTYISSTSTHPTLVKIERGSNNNQMLRVRVVMSSSGAPVSVSQLSLDVAGSANPLTNIDSISIWFTGANPNFVSPTFYGSASTQPGPYTVNGALNLLNDTNYFWVTYRVPATAAIGDSVDAAISSITIAGTPQTPTVTAPNGSRLIKGAYCTTSYANGCGTDFIARVRLENLDNSTGCNGQYTFFNNAPIPSLTVGMNYTITINYGSDGTQFGRAWVDWNDDGDFTDAGEDLGAQTPANPGSNGQATITFAVPCNVSSGNLRLRIRGGDDSQPSAAQSCGASSSGFGEGEDYLITVVNLPASYISSNTLQQTGTTSASATNIPILCAPLKVFASSCQPGLITELNFNTAGTTSPADIVSAKLYKTGNSRVFSPSNLVGTVNAPSGAFSFSVTDTAVNDTNFYWLTYDVSTTAANNNLLDARFDSAQIFGNWYAPVVSNPVGNIVISTPMTYLSSTSTHPTLSKIGTGTTNNQMLRIQVIMSSTGAPVAATQLSLSVNGSASPLTNIDSIMVWYTGSNPNFTAPTFFGGTGPQAAAYVVTGLQNLLVDTNYFWLTYRVPSTAVPGDSVDAEIASITIANNPQVPTVTAPAGNRQIRISYCNPIYTTGKTDGDLISRVRIIGTTLDNNSGTAPVNPAYTYFTGAPNLTTQLVQGSSYIMEATIGSFASQGVAAWIDYNDDGVFQATERIGFTTGTIATAFGTGSFPITLSCASTPGTFRMRVRCVYGANGNTIDPCTSYGWGEAEDYDVTILPNPTVFNSTIATQQTGTVAQNIQNLPVLRTPIRVTGCQVALLNNMYFSYSGTNVSDITSAKIYRTTNNVFSTTNLISTITSPTTNMAFSMSDPLVVNDTTWYWLAFDVSPTAVINNSIDAIYDSVNVINGIGIPSITNPAGNITILNPVQYISSTSIHPTLAKAETNSNNQMLRVRVIMSSTGSPAVATQLALSVNGSVNPLTNVDSITVWYTGANPTYTSPIFFGGVGPQSAAFNVTGSQNLLPDTNYFWVNYRVPSSANLGDSIDAEISSITIAGVSQTPTITAPVGSRQIRAPYCVSGATNSGDSDIGQLTMNYGPTVILNNGIGCTPNINNPLANGTYTNNTAQPAVQMVSGSRVDFSICYVSSGNTYASGAAIYIDFNQNGLWEAGEMVWTSPFTFTGTETGSFTLPLGILTGETRMRVVLIESIAPLTIANACNTYGYGETEDYTVNILPAPVPTTYVWNQTTPGSFTTAANWTPARVNVNLNDRLLFNNGGNVTVNDITEQSVASITVDNNSVVSLNAVTTSVLNTWDSLTLTSGRLVPNANVELSVGRSNGAGTITGTGSVQGALTRWIDNVNTNYVFPLSLNNQSRTAAINMNAPLASTGTIKVGFVSGNPSTAGIPFNDGAITVNKLAQLGLWNVSTGNGLTLAANTNYDLSLTAAGVIGVTNLSSLTIARRTNVASLWDTAGTFVTATGTTASPVVNRGSLTVFGEFAIGTDSNVNPLPVRLITFEGAAKNTDVALNWITANEQNNRGFYVERSVDGVQFERIGFVKGAGNSNVNVNYNFTDNNAFAVSNKLYYRLRQIDFDGKYWLSNSVVVEQNVIEGFTVKAYPIPSKDQLTVSVQTTTVGSAEITIHDIQGRLVRTINTDLSSGENRISIQDFNTLLPGVYFMKVTQAGKNEVLKLIKQ